MQVFATTHSRDCIDGLASVIQDKQTAGASVAIHRVSRVQTRWVTFAADEIVIAAERGIEVR